MNKIFRQPHRAANTIFDLIIIGGGIYGIFLSFEAARRGIKSLLIERDDFGEHTSFNSLRILHGGFRYLQKIDLHRFRESVIERQWFLETFPELTKPQPCLMPLYGMGVRRPIIFKIALKINDFLSIKYNQSSNIDKQLPAGGILSPLETQNLFPAVDKQNLKGSGVWYDACMPDSQRIVMEILRWSCQLGTTALNYVKVDKLLADKNKVQGVRAEDQETGEIFEFTAPTVVNATGPWSREISALFDQDLPELFKGSLAWNIVLNRESLSDHALAITPKRPNAQTYFLVPWKGMIMAGTGHVPWSPSRKKPIPAKEELLFFLADLNHAIPGFNIKLDDILHIYSGLLPAAASGETRLTNREVIINHQLRGGPEGLYSISGIKFTTARLVAEKIIKKIFPGSDIKNYKPKPDYNRDRHTTTCSDDFHWFPPVDDFDWKNRMQKLIEEEAVLHLDDLIFRRTSLGDSPNRAQTISSCLCGLFDWSEERCQNEISRIKERLTALKI